MSDRPTEKRSIKLFDGDYETLRRLHPQIGPAAAVRNLVSWYCKRQSATSERVLDEITKNLPPVEISDVNAN